MFGKCLRYNLVNLLKRPSFLIVTGCLLFLQIILCWIVPKSLNTSPEVLFSFSKIDLYSFNYLFISLWCGVTATLLFKETRDNYLDVIVLSKTKITRGCWLSSKMLAFLLGLIFTQILIFAVIALSCVIVHSNHKNLLILDGKIIGVNIFISIIFGTAGLLLSLFFSKQNVLLSLFAASAAITIFNSLSPVIHKTIKQNFDNSTDSQFWINSASISMIHPSTSADGTITYSIDKQSYTNLSTIKSNPINTYKTMTDVDKNFNTSNASSVFYKTMNIGSQWGSLLHNNDENTTGYDYTDFIQYGSSDNVFKLTKDVFDEPTNDVYTQAAPIGWYESTNHNWYLFNAKTQDISRLQDSDIADFMNQLQTLAYIPAMTDDTEEQKVNFDEIQSLITDKSLFPKIIQLYIDVIKPFLSNWETINNDTFSTLTNMYMYNYLQSQDANAKDLNNIFQIGHHSTNSFNKHNMFKAIAFIKYLLVIQMSLLYWCNIDIPNDIPSIMVRQVIEQFMDAEFNKTSFLPEMTSDVASVDSREELHYHINTFNTNLNGEHCWYRYIVKPTNNISVVLGIWIPLLIGLSITSIVIFYRRDL